ILNITDELESLFVSGASPTALNSYVTRSGFTTLADDAAVKVATGVTSHDEAVRVVGLLAAVNG
ncbi:MAG: hypothetical protein AAF404_11565, partial [Pseudomonadota bacterium]